MPFPVGHPAAGIFHPDWDASNRVPATTKLLDVCTIRRPGTGEPTRNADTGQVTAPVATVVDTGIACRVSYERPTVRRRDAGEEQLAEVTYLVELAWDFTDLANDDLIEITTVNDGGDPLLVGRVLTVLGSGAATNTWTRLVRCEHVQHS